MSSNDIYCSINFFVNAQIFQEILFLYKNFQKKNLFCGSVLDAKLKRKIPIFFTAF